MNCVMMLDTKSLNIKPVFRFIAVVVVFLGLIFTARPFTGQGIRPRHSAGSNFFVDHILGPESFWVIGSIVESRFAMFASTSSGLSISPSVLFAGIALIVFTLIRFCFCAFGVLFGGSLPFWRMVITFLGGFASLGLLISFLACLLAFLAFAAQTFWFAAVFVIPRFWFPLLALIAPFHDVFPKTSTPGSQLPFCCHASRQAVRGEIQ